MAADGAPLHAGGAERTASVTALRRRLARAAVAAVLVGGSGAVAGGRGAGGRDHRDQSAASDQRGEDNGDGRAANASRGGAEPQ